MTNTNTIARLTGLGYLIIFISGFFANFFILEGLVVDGDPKLTTLNFQNNAQAFEKGLISFAIMVTIDILLALPLYRLLRERDRTLAILSSSLRVINGLLFAWALISLWKISALFDLPVILSNANPTELQESVMLYLGNFETIWDIALIFFGVHLVFLGTLLIRSLKFPKWIGIVISTAGVAYVADSSFRLFASGDWILGDWLEIFVVLAGVIGEFSLTLFLLLKGMNFRRNRSIDLVID